MSDKQIKWKAKNRHEAIGGVRVESPEVTSLHALTQSKIGKLVVHAGMAESKRASALQNMLQVRESSFN